MLDKYKNNFPKFYEQINLVVKKNKVSHAYLIEVGNYDNYMEIIRSLVVDILKLHNDSNDYEKLIINNRYPDFVIVSPEDSRWIKKEQILNLQTIFKNKSIYNNKKIYIIDKADDLNLPAANTLLKFLEEPADDIVAILITRNKYNVIPTIRSRCQLFLLDRAAAEVNDNIEKSVVEFMLLLKRKNKKIFPYLRDFSSILENRDSFMVFVEEIIKFYQDLYRYKLQKELLYYCNYKEQVNKYVDNLDVSIITKRLIEIEELYENFRFNVNSRLMLDKLLMILVGVDINV